MLLDAAEVAKHNTPSSCWVVISGKVYDVTPYLEHHPGGAAILAKQGGRDATSEFRTVHQPDVLENLPKGSFLGEIDPAALAALEMASSDNKPAPETSLEVPLIPPPQPLTPSKEAEAKASGPPHIAHIVTAGDFEDAAKAAFSRNVYSYVSSSANTGFSLANNLSSWSRVVFRPRVLRNVRSVSPRSAIFGHASPFPFYVSAMGHLGRAHPDGEAELVRGAARRGAHVLLSTVTTRPIEEVAAALADEQKKLGLAKPKGSEEEEFPPSTLHFQLYVHPDRAVTASRIRRAKDLGFKTIWVTVDTPVLGKRTLDRRTQAEEALEAGLPGPAELAGFGQRAHVNQAQFEPALGWDDVAWIKREFGGPLVLKGVQAAEDAVLAMRAGVDGILLSNHGGRQAHSAPDALTTLLEIRTHAPEVLGRVEIFVDGGLRDGADVLKALCLGATAVGVGRPFFYALGAYGAKGVERCVDLLAEELANGMRLIGIKSLKEAKPELVNASRLLNDMWRPEKSRL